MRLRFWEAPPCGIIMLVLLLLLATPPIPEAPPTNPPPERIAPAERDPLFEHLSRRPEHEPASDKQGPMPK